MDQAEIELNNLKVGEFVELANGQVWVVLELFYRNQPYCQLICGGVSGVDLENEKAYVSELESHIRIWTMRWRDMISDINSNNIRSLITTDYMRHRHWRPAPKDTCEGEVTMRDGKKYRLEPV